MRTLLSRLLVLGICLLGGVHAVLAERVTTFYHTDVLGSVVAATGTKARPGKSRRSDIDKADELLRSSAMHERVNRADKGGPLP